jgi:Domain of unknown function (DUF6265)
MQNLNYSMLALSFMLASINCLAQTNSANTMALAPSASSPPARLSDVQWIQGHWRGEAFGGITEEVWTPPLGGSMMCAFKLVVDGKVSFYEIVSLAEEGNSLIIRLKHFHGDLKGWEEKDKTVDFRLVKIVDNRAYFDGMTFERVSPDELNVYVMIGKPGEEKEILFKYKRVNG